MLRSHQKEPENKLVHENLFTTFSVPAREQVLSWEKKIPMSDAECKPLGGMQTTPRKTPKTFCEAAILLSLH